MNFFRKSDKLPAAKKDGSVNGKEAAKVEEQLVPDEQQPCSSNAVAGTQSMEQGSQSKPVGTAASETDSTLKRVKGPGLPALNEMAIPMAVAPIEMGAPPGFGNEGFNRRERKLFFIPEDDEEEDDDDYIFNRPTRRSNLKRYRAGYRNLAALNIEIDFRELEFVAFEIEGGSDGSSEDSRSLYTIWEVDEEEEEAENAGKKASEKVDEKIGGQDKK